MKKHLGGLIFFLISMYSNAIINSCDSYKELNNVDGYERCVLNNYSADEAANILSSYYFGIKNNEKGKYFLLHAIALESTIAMVYRANLAFRGHVYPKDRRTALLYYKMASERGSIIADQNLGFYYMYEGDLNGAVYYFEKAHEQDKLLSSMYLGVLRLAEEDKQKGFLLLEESFMNGNLSAYFVYLNYLIDHFDVRFCEQAFTNPKSILKAIEMDIAVPKNREITFSIWDSFISTLAASEIKKDNKLSNEDFLAKLFENAKMKTSKISCE